MLTAQQALPANLNQSTLSTLSILSKEDLITLIMQLQQSNLNLQIDHLTGFYKREAVQNINKDVYTVAMIDINGLKSVNDSLGHKAGDSYILSVCDGIKANIRKEDKVIRFGGDEFVIIFDNCTTEQAKQICKRVTNASCGVGQANTLDEAIKLADNDMYINKRDYYNYKNQVL
jgi:PleD family two-component response regulator